MTIRGFLAICLLLAPAPGLPLAADGRQADPLDRILRTRLARHGVVSPDPGPLAPSAQVNLGRLLFFDPILSGNRDISCATCHHPELMTGDGLSLPVGTLGDGLGPDRAPDPACPFIPRNSPELFDRGSPAWRTLFWDGRLEAGAGGLFRNPAGDLLPPGLESVLAAQAMFPVTSRHEMRGDLGDPDNELCSIPDHDFRGIWRALMVRLLAIPDYRELFAEAYPAVPPDSLGFQHAANAIAAFESAAFTLGDSPFDRYLIGDDDALSRSAKLGAMLFLGKARCAGCHNGPLLTDQQFYNIAVPQLGPGKAPEAPLDFGRARVTGDPRDLFAFRTPPLRNVAVSGPWMHNGAYTTLEGAIRHHLRAIPSLLTYDASQLPPDLRSTVQDDPDTLRAIIASADPRARRRLPLSHAEVQVLLAFLDSLTSPAIDSLGDTVPQEVPSGLPVDRLPED